VSELFGYRNNLFVSATHQPTFEDPEAVYAPVLQPIIEVLSFLSKLVTGTDPFRVWTSNKPKVAASLSLKIYNPWGKDEDSEYIDLEGFKFKGVFEAGLGNSSAVLSDADILPSAGHRPVVLGAKLPVPGPDWYYYMAATLGLGVMVLPKVYGKGEAKLLVRAGARGNERQIRLTWAVELGRSDKLGPFRAFAKYYYGLELIYGSAGFQIGILVGIFGTLELLDRFASATIKLEIMGGIRHLTTTDPPKNFLIARGKLAFEVTVCWFLTISFEGQVEHQEEVRF
jgi:hypothetical protein